MARLKDKYLNEVVPGLQEQFKYTNVMAIPKLDKVVVEGVAIVKRHTKPTQKMPQGGIIEKEAAIHVSNVMPFCSTCKKGVRVAHTIENGTKTRVCRKCGKAL